MVAVYVPLPGQALLVELETLHAGREFTVTVVVAVVMQFLLSVPVTVYVVVVVGDATGFAILALLNPAAGNHE